MAAAVAPTGGQYTQSCYDALGRTTGSAFIGAGAGPVGGSPPATSYTTSTAYSSASNNSIVTVTARMETSASRAPTC